MNSAQSTGLKQKNPFEHKIWNCTNHTGLQFFKVYKRCYLLRNCFYVSIRNSSVQDFSPVLVTTMFFLFPHWKMLRLSFSTGRAVHKCHCVTSPLPEKGERLKNGGFLEVGKVSLPPESCLEERQLGERCEEGSPWSHMQCSESSLYSCHYKTVGTTITLPTLLCRETLTVPSSPASCKLP